VAELPDPTPSNLVVSPQEKKEVPCVKNLDVEARTLYPM